MAEAYVNSKVSSVPQAKRGKMKVIIPEKIRR